jgi:nitroreductase/NAD-dependent dihydropyrimidine dehydrogenase PreA subunit
MNQIAIDSSRCRKDGLCATVCPARIFTQREKATVPEVAGKERCIACGHCLAICRSAAISHSAFPPGSISPIDLEKMPSPEQVMELLRARRSIRAFREEPLEKEAIETIIEGARLAPSAHNSQSTRFFVVLDQAVLSQVSALTIEYLRFEVRRLNSFSFRMLGSVVNKKLVEWGRQEIPSLEWTIRRFEAGEDPILHHAPALLVFHARRGVGLADVNAHLALQNASLLASSMGVGHFYTGWVMAACRAPMSQEWRKRIPSLLGIPPENRLHGALALGYPVPEFKNWIDKKPARIQWR